MPDLLALGLLLAVALLLLARQILFGGTFDNDDIVLQSIPVYSWFADGLKRGEFPIWSPSILGGFPLAFAQYGFFYPPDMALFWLLDVAGAFHLSLALHLALAGWCTYWYCRLLGLRRIPSLLAAVVFQMGNEPLAWPANGYITRTLFALPALLATVELAVRKNPRHGLLAAPIVGAALLVGYAQMVLFALMVSGAYALVVVKRDSLRALPFLAAGVALGLGMAAVRVMPTLAVTALSTRSGGMDLGSSSVDSIEPWALVAGYLLPSVFDLPGRFAVRPDYIGGPALFLAVLAMAWPRRLGRVGLFHVAVALVAIALSLGASTPLYWVLLELPFFSYFRGPNRFSLVVAFSLAVLAAFALDRRLALDLRGHRGRRYVATSLAMAGGLAGAVALAMSLAFQFGRDPFSDALRSAAQAGGWDLLNLLRPRVGVPVLGLVAVPLIALGCARSRFPHRALEWSALFLSVATLFLLGWIQNPWLRSEALYDAPALLASMQGAPHSFRLFSWTPRISTYNVGAYYTGVVGYPPPRDFDARYLRQFIPPNLGMLFGVETADGYEVLQSRRQALLAAYMGSERTDPARFSDGRQVDQEVRGRAVSGRLNLLAALNVEYLVYPFALDDPRLEPLGQADFQIYPNLGAVASVRLYRLKDAMPRAFLVPDSRMVPEEKDVLGALSDGTVDLKKSVILEQAAPALAGERLTEAGSTVEIAEYRDDEVVLRARTDGSGYLVLMDFLMLGWTATVDGQPEPILAANFAGRAVLLQGVGEHQVVFRYRAPLLQEGLLVSLASIALLVLLALWRPLGGWLSAE